MNGESTWGYPRARPYRLLAVVALVGAIQAFSVVIAPPDPDVSRAGFAAVGVVSSGVALVLLTVGPRIGPWLLTTIVIVAVVLVGAVSLLTRTGEGQLLAGFSMTLLGVYSAYFLSAAVVRVVLVVSAVLYCASLWLNPQLAIVWFGVIVAVLNVGITLIVASLVRHLRRMALHDPLTGALNRHGLADGADLAHELDVRGNAVTTVVEIDLDGFKQYNDRHGHEAGDRLLASVVSDWSGVLRRTDLLARTGGDEFVLILPATDAAEAAALLERMRQANPAAWSAGVAVWEPGERMPEALRRADLAMYAHKGPRHDEDPARTRSSGT